MEPKYMRFKNLTEAWRGINEYLVLEEKEVWRRGGGLYGPSMVSYNNLIVVEEAIVDPEFDFGRILGYSNKKWSSLVSNYVDFYYLDLLRTEINLRKNRQAKSYNYTYHFKNKHGSGKDCLISINFTKRLYASYPIVTFYTRVSEVTKRLIWDFLLVQRIVEYVYGSAEGVMVQFYTDSFFMTSEGFMMYDNVKPLRKFFKQFKDNPGKFQSKVMKTYKEFMEVDVETVNFKVHRRSVAQLQKDKDGNPISNVKSLLAKDIPRFDSKAYPAEVLHKRQITKHEAGPVDYTPGKRGRGRPRKEESIIENSPKKTIKIKKIKKK